MEITKTILFKSATIFYRCIGSGKPVVFIHGFGEDGNIWNALVNDLKDKYRVIIPDLPGSGKSEILKEGDTATSIDDYAEAIVNILKNESVDKCTVIGHSMGGYITLAIADIYPEALNGFGLFNSTAFADSEEKKQDRLRSIEFMQKHGGVSFLKASFPGLFAENFKRNHNNEIEQLIDSLDYFKSEALIQYTRAMMNRIERIKILQTTPLPVLFIIGETDPAIPLEKSLAQCHLPAASFVRILADTGHMGMIEKKEASVESVSAYLDSFFDCGNNFYGTNTDG